MMECKENDASKISLILPRNSPLTDLFKDKHNRTIYHACIAISLWLLLNALMDSYVMERNYIVGFRLLRSGLQNFHLAFIVWVVINITVLLSFKCYNIWANTRLKLGTQTSRVWDRSWISTLVLYYITVLYVSSKSIYIFNLPFITAVVLQIETVRLLMKVHSFIRNSAAEFVNQSKVQNISQIKVRKHFGRFFYYLFAPTLIYRDTYSRTQAIRWRFVAVCALEFILDTVAAAIVVDLYLLRPFENMGNGQISRKKILLSLLCCNFAGMFLMIWLFYLSLHVFQNLFAEITRFADRGFYQNWWYSSDVIQYLKTWNLLVNNWLFIYVYKDVYENVYHNKEFAKLMVMFTSSVIHELILMSSLRMFFPVLFLLFFVSALVGSSCKVKGDNKLCFLWRFLYFWGSGFVVTAYCLEYTARYYFPATEYNAIDYILPRTLALIFER